VETLKPEKKGRGTLKGYTHVEAADEIGVPLGTIKPFKDGNSAVEKTFN